MCSNSENVQKTRVSSKGKLDSAVICHVTGDVSVKWWITLIKDVNRGGYVCWE